MTTVLDSLRTIINNEAKLRDGSARIVVPPIELTEVTTTSRCKPVALVCRSKRQHFGVRLEDGDCLPLLAELPAVASVRKLPDYLVFIEPEDPSLLPNILVAELKSGERGAESAPRQVQLGFVLAEYLLRLAWFHAGLSRNDMPPPPWMCGLIASESLPSSLAAPKAATKPGRIELPSKYDGLVSARIYRCVGG
ncbi:MAG: hypothetical protein U0165_02100, partial [Polyangiaceae bacterium]